MSIVCMCIISLMEISWLKIIKICFLKTKYGPQMEIPQEKKKKQNSHVHKKASAVGSSDRFCAENSFSPFPILLLYQLFLPPQ